MADGATGLLRRSWAMISPTAYWCGPKHPPIEPATRAAVKNGMAYRRFPVLDATIGPVSSISLRSRPSPLSAVLGSQRRVRRTMPDPGAANRDGDPPRLAARRFVVSPRGSLQQREPIHVGLREIARGDCHQDRGGSGGALPAVGAARQTPGRMTRRPATQGINSKTERTA